VLAVVAEFENDTHRTKTMELLSLRQLGYVEEYRKQFDTSLSATMLTAQFIMGLKEELRLPVEM
jgi:hypothetical protein